MKVPAPSWLSTYRREWLGRDVAGRLTEAALVIPQVMAYAPIAGLTGRSQLDAASDPTRVFADLHETLEAWELRGTATVEPGSSTSQG